MNKPVVLVDGSSYFFRAFHALPPLMTSTGLPTGAVYGVANMIKRLIKDYDPKYIAVIFDAKGETFRNELYPQYKATRNAMPQDLQSQFEPLVEVLKAMGIPVIIIPKVEADDVIGTLSCEAVREGLEVLISTSDKDMAQLVNDKVTLINTMSNKTLDITGVFEKFGVYPHQIIDYLTLTGDTSDNIPGIPKCGPKTAAKWLVQYKTLDELLEHANEITGKIGEYLMDTIPLLPTYKKLVTIKLDLDLNLHFNELEKKSPDTQKLIALTQKFEFKNWLKELLTESSFQEPEKTESLNYEIIDNAESLAHLITDLKNQREFCLCLQGTNADPMLANLLCLTIAYKQKICCIPFSSSENKCVDVVSTLNALKPILQNPDITKAGHDLKFAYVLLKNYNITLKGIKYDAMLASYVFNSTASNHDLDALSLKYLGTKLQTLSEICGLRSKKRTYSELKQEEIASFATSHAELTQKLNAHFNSLLNTGTLEVYNKIELPLLSILGDMQFHGVKIDIEVLKQQGKSLKHEINRIEEEVLSIAGKSFNLNSPKQLQEILFVDLKLPIIAKTPTGIPSTAEAVLQELAYDYRLPELILRYRSLSKLLSTYVEALPRKVNPTTKRIHTSYNQAITATGRLSSSEPNLQNIPIRTLEGRNIRKAFIAESGYVLLAADYSQIELRLMAHLSQDQNLLQAFSSNLDIHTATASEIFNVSQQDVSMLQRRSAKAVNFGLIYGMSAFGLAKQIGVSREEAQSYINSYFCKYPRVLDYMERVKATAKSQGYVETIFGRKLYIPEITASNQIRRKAAERMAVNAPLQGSAADIIKCAMINVANWLESEKIKATMVMQVHDELVFEVLETDLAKISQKIKVLMETAAHLCVPLEVSLGSGKNWEGAH